MKGVFVYLDGGGQFCGDDLGQCYGFCGQYIGGDDVVDQFKILCVVGVDEIVGYQQFECGVGWDCVVECDYWCVVEQFDIYFVYVEMYVLCGNSQIVVCD